MTRYLSIWLPDLPIERLRRSAPDPRAPAAVWTNQHGGRRLTSVNAAARRAGLKTGLTLATARASLPALVLIENDPHAQALCLAAVLNWSRRFTPLAALDPPDGLMLDISGVAHLFGGEAALMRDFATRLAKQGFAIRSAIAGSSELAYALAHFDAGTIAPDQAAEKLLMRLAALLPLAALRLPPDTIAGLAQAGLRRIGDIFHRPRAPLAARWGEAIFARLDGLLERSSNPINPVFESPAYLVERRFAEGIARREDIEATLLGLAHELARMLERHGEGARRLAAFFFRVDGVVKDLEAGSSQPLRDGRRMARLFHERIEAIGEDGLDTGYGFELIRLAALEVETLAPRQDRLALSQAAPEPLFAVLEQGSKQDKAPDELCDLIDRLGARLGSNRVVRLSAHESHIPERAVAAIPLFKASGHAQTGAALKSKVQPRSKPRSVQHWPRPTQGEDAPARPIRLLERPEPVQVVATAPDGPPLRFVWRRQTHEIIAVEGPERIGAEWWKEAETFTRDYFRVADARGHGFWLYREGLYETETVQPRWFLHGLFH